ncbi:MULTISPECIES: esterase/lipase family protein [Nocardia]|uniref:esterase/lipase family protein n=1 Tax=Nocardia TaxID=1817 RepID=UPI0018E5455F|nr:MULTISPECIES: lipase [Nocardia]
MFDRLLVLATAASAAFTPLAAAPAAAAPAASTAPATTRGVVVIVPGQSLGSLPYQPMAAELRADGYTSLVLDLKGFDVAADAASVAVAVDAAHTEYPGVPVALVTHSIGALSGRYYLRDLGGADRIATYIAIGAPQYGSPGACGQSVGAEICPDTRFMADLNAGDDTPGPTTTYYSIRSEREWSDGRLDGGQCRITPFPTLGNGGVDHALEPLLPAVLPQVRGALAGVCDGEFVDEPDGAIDPRSTLFPNGVPYS